MFFLFVFFFFFFFWGGGGGGGRGLWALGEQLLQHLEVQDFLPGVGAQVLRLATF